MTDRRAPKNNQALVRQMAAIGACTQALLQRFIFIGTFIKTVV